MSNSYINILKENNVFSDILKNKSMFPCYKISKHSKMIVKFVTEISGYVIFPGDNHSFQVGKYATSWVNVYNNSTWRDLTNAEYNKYVNKFGWITNE